MTETLAEKTCTPCRGGVPPLGRDEALRFQAQAPDWGLRDEARRIERTFRFHNFREALAFVQHSKFRSAAVSWALSKGRWLKNRSDTS
jgi:4a-hydroxytetrahydrobiopterin dehydratase